MGMRYWVLGVGVFGLMVGVLFAARFQIVPTPGQYAFGVVWSAMMAWSVAVIARRMARPPQKKVRRVQR